MSKKKHQQQADHGSDIAAAAPETDAEEQMEEKADLEPSPTMGPNRISVRAVRESFIRCGRKFTKAPTVIDVKALTEDELARLLSEPQLEVTSL